MISLARETYTLLEVIYEFWKASSRWTGSCPAINFLSSSPSLSLSFLLCK